MLTFMHLIVAKGRLTVAISLPENSDKVDVAMAFSSPKDQFSRKKGRRIAEGRLKSDKERFKFSIPVPPKDVRLKDTVVEHIAGLLAAEQDDHKVPLWAQGEIPVRPLFGNHEDHRSGINSDGSYQVKEPFGSLNVDDGVPHVIK